MGSRGAGMADGRFEPYTEAGVRRVPCARCGKPGHACWNICADSVGSRTRYRALCAACDVALNVLVMRWAFGDTREADIAAYSAKVLGEQNSPAGNTGEMV